MFVEGVGVLDFVTTGYYKCFSIIKRVKNEEICLQIFVEHLFFIFLFR